MEVLNKNYLKNYKENTNISKIKYNLSIKKEACN